MKTEIKIGDLYVYTYMDGTQKSTFLCVDIINDWFSEQNYIKAFSFKSNKIMKIDLDIAEENFVPLLADEETG